MREVPTRQAISRYITVMHGMTNLQVFLSSFLRPRLLGFFNLVIHSHATWFLFIVIILLPLWLFRLLSLETLFELFRDYLPCNGQYSNQGREHEVRILSSTIFPFFSLSDKYRQCLKITATFLQLTSQFSAVLYRKSHIKKDLRAEEMISHLTGTNVEIVRYAPPLVLKRQMWWKNKRQGDYRLCLEWNLYLRVHSTRSLQAFSLIAPPALRTPFQSNRHGQDQNQSFPPRHRQVRWISPSRKRSQRRKPSDGQTTCLTWRSCHWWPLGTSTVNHPCNSYADANVKTA